MKGFKMLKKKELKEYSSVSRAPKKGKDCLMQAANLRENGPRTVYIYHYYIKDIKKNDALEQVTSSKI